MNELLLSIGFFLQVLSVIWIIFLIRDRRAKKRLKEESLNLEELYGITDTTYRGWREYDNRNNPMPLRERYGGILEEKGDFIPKKRIRAHKLEEMGPLTKSGRPDMRYSANRGDRGNIAEDFMEDESGPATVCDNQYPF